MIILFVVLAVVILAWYFIYYQPKEANEHRDKIARSWMTDDEFQLLKTNPKTLSPATYQIQQYLWQHWVWGKVPEERKKR